MTIKIVTTVDDLAAITAEKMFEELRTHVHALDDQLSDAGAGNADFCMQVLCGLSVQLAEYATYMSAGMYLLTRKDDGDDLAVGMTKALLKDYKEAAKQGLERARRQSEKISGEMSEAEAAVAALFKKARGSCH